MKSVRIAVRALAFALTPGGTRARSGLARVMTAVVALRRAAEVLAPGGEVLISFEPGVASNGLRRIARITANLDQLNDVGARPRGVVLNRVDLNRDWHNASTVTLANYSTYGGKSGRKRPRRLGKTPQD